jgi:hypothetical protein
MLGSGSKPRTKDQGPRTKDQEPRTKDPESSIISDKSQVQVSQIVVSVPEAGE